MKVSPSGKMIATADTLGKIKIVDFPNIYNMLTVLLYNNEDIKFCDFLNNQILIVINSNYEIHIWNLNDFKLKSKFDLKTILDMKIEKRQETQDITTVCDENKKENDNQESNFCNEDENIKNVFYVNGNKFIIQIKESVKFIKEEDANKRFITFCLSDSDEISSVDDLVLNKIQSDERTFLFISDVSEKILFFKHSEENKENDLNIISELNFNQLQ